MSDEAAQTTKAFIGAINAADLPRLRSLMTDDHTFTDALGNSFKGGDAMLVGWRHFLDAYPRYKIEIRQTFASGNQVALFGEAHGSWRVNDRVLSQTWKVSAAWLAEVTAGKVRSWSVFCDTGWAKPPQT